jgi:chitodextrinase
MNFFGLRPNAWGGAPGEGEVLYNFFKYIESGGSASNDTGVNLYGSGDGNQISHNHIHDNVLGIRLMDGANAKNTKIFGNVIGHNNSIGIAYLKGFTNTEIFNNIIHNCNLNIRWHRLEDGGRTAYVYSNRFYNPKGIGTHLYTHANGSCGDNTLYFYHNSTSGGKEGLLLRYCSHTVKHKGMNNILGSSSWMAFGLNRAMDFMGDDKDYFSTPDSAIGKAERLSSSLPGMNEHYPDDGAIFGRWPDPGPGHAEISVPHDEEPPTTPTDLEITDVQSNSISLSWKASTDRDSGVKGYEIFRDGSSVGTTGTTSYSDTGLLPETKYTYQVLAYDFNDNKSSRSDPISGTTKEPGAPDYTFLKAQGPITLDGDLSKYDDASAVTLNAPNGDNTITFRGLWNETGIYLAFEVEDPDLLADTPAGKPWADDSVEWFLDVRGNSGGDGNLSSFYMDENDYHAIVNIDNAYYSVRGTQDTSTTPPWIGTWNSFVQRHSGNDGYTLEIEIPWSSLSLPAPTTDIYMGFSFALNDKDPASKTNFIWANGAAPNYQNASQWKRVKISSRTPLPNDDRPKAPGGLRVEPK